MTSTPSASAKEGVEWSYKLLAKEWLVQSVVMNGSEFHENLGGWLISGLIVDALSLLVAIYPFGMLLVDRRYESVFCNLRVRFTAVYIWRDPF